jgi:hypothetical protein
MVLHGTPIRLALPPIKIRAIVGANTFPSHKTALLPMPP